MTRFLLLITAFTTIFLSGCASQLATVTPVNHNKPVIAINMKERHDILIGTWFGEAPAKGGGYRKWIIHRYDDGTYEITFRLYKAKDDYKENIEVGEWGISGNIYFTIMKGWMKHCEFVPVDPSNPYFYDAYYITNLNQTICEYESTFSDDKFIIKKVKDDFQFPEK